MAFIVFINGSEDLDGVIPAFELKCIQMFGFIFVIVEIFLFCFAYNMDIKAQLARCWINKPVYFHILSILFLLPFMLFLLYKILYKLISVTIFEFKCLKNY